MLLKENTGDVRIHRVNNQGLVTSKAWSSKWSNGWTTMEFFRTSSGTFLFLMKKQGLSASSRNVHIHKMTSDGEVGDRVDDRKWTSGWTIAHFYRQGSQNFMLLLKEEGTGAGEYNVHVHKIEENGKVGERVQNFKTREGWTTAKVYQTNSGKFLFLLAESDGEVAIFKLNDNGTIDLENKVASHNWTSGWDTVEFYRENNTTILFLLKSSGFSASSRNVHIHEMNSDGTVGSRVIDYAWTQGWDTISIGNFSGMNHLALLKSGNGQGHHHQINSDGTVGKRVDPDEPNSLDFYKRLWTPLGNGQGYLNDYWRDMSRNQMNLNGSYVSGWHTIPQSWEEVKELNRHGKIQAGLDAAISDGYQPPSNHEIAVIHSSQPDSGVSGNRILGHPNRDNLTFLAHEMGHVFGLGHTFSNDEDATNASWASPGEYDDRYDLMSAMRVRTFTPPGGVRSGPGLNAFNLRELGWLNPSDTIQITTKNRYRVIVIRSLSDRAQRYCPPYFIRVPIAKNPRSRRVRDYYSVELRTPTNWDSGLGDAKSLIHKHTSERSYLIRTLGNHARHRQPVGHIYDTDNEIAITTLQVLSNQGEGIYYVSNTRSNIQIHRLGHDGVPTGELYRNQWSSGWTTAKFFNTQQGHYLFLLKEQGAGADGYNVHIHRVQFNGAVGMRVDSRKWTGGWSTVEFFTVNNKTYLFLLKKEGAGADNHNIHTHEMNDDGKVGDRLQSVTTLEGFTTAKIYNVDGKDFLFLLSESDGTVHIHEFENNGFINFDSKIATHNWSSGWDTVQFFRTGGNTYLFLMKSSGFSSSSRNVHIHRMNSDGTVGERVIDYAWTQGWTNATFYTIGGDTYLKILSEQSTGGSGHNLHTHKMNDDGTVGNRISEYKWASGWKNLDAVIKPTIGGENGLFLVNK